MINHLCPKILVQVAKQHKTGKLNAPMPCCARQKFSYAAGTLSQIYTLATGCKLYYEWKFPFHPLARGTEVYKMVVHFARNRQSSGPLEQVISRISLCGHSMEVNDQRRHTMATGSNIGGCTLTTKNAGGETTLHAWEIVCNMQG